MEESLQKIIYGKNNTTNIVSIEPGDNYTELFIEKDGKVSSTFVPNEFWILAHKQITGDWVKLKGTQHYCYGKKYKTHGEWLTERSRLRKYNDIWSIFDIKEQFMVKNGYTYFKGMEPKDVSILSFDIETTGKLLNDSSKVLIIANTFRNALGTHRKLFSYDTYPNEGEMIKDWCRWVREVNPSIVCGHNINIFDFPYLQFVADKHNVTLDLGRDGSTLKINNYESEYRKDGSQFYKYKKIKIYGREIIDTFFLALKYDISRKYDSYGLKNIVIQENIVIPGRVYYDASKIGENYKNKEQFELIKQYSQYDGDESLQLFDLMISAYFYLANMVPKSPQAIIEGASGSQLNSMLIRAYNQDGKSIPKASEVSEYKGGISFGVPGNYKNALKIDIRSEYPSCIRQYKVYDRKKDPEAYMLKITNILTEERFKLKKLAQETKEQIYKDRDSASKVILNSLYGMLGAPGLNYNSPLAAEFVTMKGRELLKFAIKWASGNDYIENEN